MAGAFGRAFLLVCIADVVIAVILRVGQAETLPAMVALQESGEEVHETGGALMLPRLQPFVSVVPELFRDKRRKDVLHYDPLVFRFPDNPLVLEGQHRSLAVDAVTEVRPVIQHIVHRSQVPVIRVFRV